MKIANAALLLLAFEGGAKVHGFSAYLNALTGPAAFAKSSYAISQTNPPQPTQPVKTGNDYLSGISGPESILKAPANEYLGSSQQPNGYGVQPPPITASTSTTGASYLNSVGSAAAAAAKPASYSPFGTKPKAVEPSGPSYLGNLADASPVQYTAPPPAAAQVQPQSYVAPPQVQPSSYSPFGAKPKSVAESGYLGGLTGGVTVQASSSSSTYSAPAASASAPPAASRAAPASYSPFGAKPKQVAESGYLGNLGGASPAVQYSAPPPAASQVQPQSYTTPPQVKPSSYSPFGAKPKAVADAGYLGNLKGGAPPAAASQAQPQSYTAPPQVKPSSYSPFGAKPKAVAEAGYLGNLGGSAPAVQYSAPQAAAPQTYTAPPQVKPSSYSPFGAKPKAVAESGYLGNLGTASPAVQYSAPPAAASQAQPQSYTAPPQVKPSSYSPFGAKPKAVAEAGYLGNLGGASPAVQYSAPPAAASQAQPQSYTAPPQVKPSSYSPFGAKPKAVAESGYLGNLGGSAPAQASTYSAPVAASAAPPQALFSAAPKSYSPFGAKPKAVAESGYLGNLSGAPAAAQVTAPQAVAQPQSSVAPPQGKPTSYSPFGAKPKAVAEAGYLGGLTGSSVQASSAPVAAAAPPAVTSAPPTSYSPFGSKPKAVAETGYLGGLTGGSTIAPATSSQPPAVSAARPAVSSAPTSYSPFGSKPKVVAESGYLGGLTGGATTTASVAPPQPAASASRSAGSSSSPTSYSPFGSKPKAVAESGYLGGLTGGAVTAASSYASSPPPAAPLAPPAAASAGPTKYSPFGSKPKAVAESGYLGNLAGATMTTSSYAPAATSPPSATSNEVRPAAFSPFGSKPRAPENPSGYLGGLAGASMSSTFSAAPAAAQPYVPPAAPAAASKPASYAGFGTKPKAVATSGYLGAL